MDGRESIVVSVQKQPNGRFRARLKNGRVNVASKTFDTKREAEQWLARERAALERGIDPRAGQQRVRVLLQPWLASRRSTVAAKTYRVDADLERVLPTSLLALQVAAVGEREIARCFEHWISRGFAERTAARYRASLSSFLGWCARERYILSNPVTGVRVPRQSAVPTEMSPFTEEELEEAYWGWQQQNQRLAEVLLVLGWTGLRWSEARAALVENLMRVPTPGLVVRRGPPGGHLATRSANDSHDCSTAPASFAQVRTEIRVGAACRNRTDDLLITSETLYRLS